jgi:hypothetical protein
MSPYPAYATSDASEYGLPHHGGAWMQRAISLTVASAGRQSDPNRSGKSAGMAKSSTLSFLSLSNAGMKVIDTHEFALSTGELLILCRYLTQRTVNAAISLKADHPTQNNGVLLTPFCARSLFVLDKTLQPAMHGIICKADGTETPCSVRLSSMRYLDLPRAANERYWHESHDNFPHRDVSLPELPLPAFLHSYCLPPLRSDPPP